MPIKTLKIKTSKWIVFCLFALIIFAKNIIFQYAVFGDLYLNNVVEAFKFYGGSFAFAVFLSSFVFISKHKPWWSVIILLAIDIWSAALLIYFRSWGIWMNIDVIKMADNMSGFWSSVWTYISPVNWLFLTITIFYAVFLFFSHQNNQNRSWKIFLILLLLAYCYVPSRQFITWRRGLDNIKLSNPYTNPILYHTHNIAPLFRPYRSIRDKAYVSYIGGVMAVWEDTYIRKQGFVDYALAMTVFQVTYDYYYWKNDEKDVEIIFTDEEQNYLNTIATRDTCTFVPTRSLVFILVESFESWVIEYKGEGGYAMPNLRKFMLEHNTFYADKLKSQAKFGGSGDGQMLMMTGLVPLRKGAACRLYGNNIYPNFAHFYPCSITLNPSVGAWNQPVVNRNYGIKELYEGDDLKGSDENVFKNLMTRLDTCSLPTFYLVITVSSHTPFQMAESIDWPVDKNMPKTMRNYIKCMHYEDEQFGKLITMMEQKNLFETTDLVITGDHIIFQKMMLKEIQDYAETTNLSIKNGENYCPLIISTPTMGSKSSYTGIAYQMDAFPTIISAIGIENYWWKGFGDNLIDGNRNITSSNELIEIVSDKVIRSNYFANTSK